GQQPESEPATLLATHGPIAAVVASTPLAGRCRGWGVANHQGSWSTPFCRPAHCGAFVSVRQVRTDRAVFLAHRLCVIAEFCAMFDCWARSTHRQSGIDA